MIDINITSHQSPSVIEHFPSIGYEVPIVCELSSSVNLYKSHEGCSYLDSIHNESEIRLDVDFTHRKSELSLSYVSGMDPDQKISLFLVVLGNIDFQ